MIHLDLAVTTSYWPSPVFNLSVFSFYFETANVTETVDVTVFSIVDVS
jgi:hypothetical protein